MGKHIAKFMTATTKRQWYAVTVGLAIVTNFVAFLYACVLERQSSAWWHTDAFSSSSGNFTYEAWACQMRWVFVTAGEPDAELGRICDVAVRSFFFSCGFFWGSLDLLTMVVEVESVDDCSDVFAFAWNFCCDVVDEEEQ